MGKRIEFAGCEGPGRGSVLVAGESASLDEFPFEVGLTHGSGTSQFLRFVDGSYYFRKGGYFAEHPLGEGSALGFEPESGGRPPLG